MGQIRSIRGMNDILPGETELWQWVEHTIARLLGSYGYREIRFPIVEQTELFKRSIGEVTDIVEKEMYTFNDRNDDSLTLRPEGTACCVRACNQHGLLHNQQQRLWYNGPMFRYERPQKGRQRQFHQVGVECFGMVGPDIDAELLLLTARLWRQLGVADAVRLELNSIGSLASRAAYKAALVDYLQAYATQLDPDSQRRLHTNPLRILDSKEPATQALLADAPDMADYLDEASKAHFDGVKQLLDSAGIPYTLNSRLVRGLDYYNDMVFEWVTDALGAQGTVCAGGRYDGLVAQLGGSATPGVGFAMGLERLCLLVQEVGKMAPADTAVDAYVVCLGDQHHGQVLQWIEQLRDSLPDLRVQVHAGGGSSKSQMKKADKSGAALALIIGPDEVAAGQIVIKPLRGQMPQQNVAAGELAAQIAQILAQ